MYSDWCSGTIQNALTPLTLRITEDSAKQLVDCLQLTVISVIGLLGERNVFYFLPAHSEMFRFFERKATGSSVKLLQHYNLGVHIGVHIGDYKPCFLVLFNITW